MNGIMDSPEDVIKVFRDHHGHACLRVESHPRHTVIIENNGSSIELRKVSTAEFDAAYIPMLYDVDRAVERYLNPITSATTITHAARERLLQIKEAEMAKTETAKKPAGSKAAPAGKGKKEALPLDSAKVVNPGKAAEAKAKPAKEAKAKPAKEAKAKPAKEAKAPRGESKKIKLLVKENPKRKGSNAYSIFELYSTCKTTDEFLANGGTASSMRYDEKAGFIELS